MTLTLPTATALFGLSSDFNLSLHIPLFLHYETSRINHNPAKPSIKTQTLTKRTLLQERC